MLQLTAAPPPPSPQSGPSKTLPSPPLSPPQNCCQVYPACGLQQVRMGAGQGGAIRPATGTAAREHRLGWQRHPRALQAFLSPAPFPTPCKLCKVARTAVPLRPAPPRHTTPTHPSISYLWPALRRHLRSPQRRCGKHTPAPAGPTACSRGGEGIAVRQIKEKRREGRPPPQPQFPFHPCPPLSSVPTHHLCQVVLQPPPQPTIL